MKPHRPILERGESRIHDLLAHMSEAVDTAIEQALASFRDHDTERAVQIVASDQRINDLHHQIEDECFTIIALQQPVASDLRDIFSDTLISSELERIADHAADIAKIVLRMDGPANPEHVTAIDALGTNCREMLAQVMAAYVNYDENMAREVAARDEEIDMAEAMLTDKLLAHMCDNVQRVRRCTHTLWVAHNLERIGDRVTNIAERIVFITSGKVTDLNR